MTAREQLDDGLDTRLWRVIPGWVAPRRAPEDADAPSWWVSDEEASDSFMRAYGGG